MTLSHEPVHVHHTLWQVLSQPAHGDGGLEMCQNVLLTEHPWDVLLRAWDMLLDSWRRVQTQQRNAPSPMIIAAIQVLCGRLHRRRHGQVVAHIRWPEVETGQWEMQCRRAVEELHEFPAEVSDGFVVSTYGPCYIWKCRGYDSDMTGYDMDMI